MYHNDDKNESSGLCVGDHYFHTVRLCLFEFKSKKYGYEFKNILRLEWKMFLNAKHRFTINSLNKTEPI